MIPDIEMNVVRYSSNAGTFVHIVNTALRTNRDFGDEKQIIFSERKSKTEISNPLA
jgi:hypothetical protein